VPPAAAWRGDAAFIQRGRYLPQALPPASGDGFDLAADLQGALRRLTPADFRAFRWPLPEILEIAAVAA
jgi:hypothetical protein